MKASSLSLVSRNRPRRGQGACAIALRPARRGLQACQANGQVAQPRRVGIRPQGLPGPLIHQGLGVGRQPHQVRSQPQPVVFVHILPGSGVGQGLGGLQRELLGLGRLAAQLCRQGQAQLQRGVVVGAPGLALRQLHVQGMQFAGTALVDVRLAGQAGVVHQTGPAAAGEVLGTVRLPAGGTDAVCGGLEQRRQLRGRGVGLLHRSLHAPQGAHFHDVRVIARWSLAQQRGFVRVDGRLRPGRLLQPQPDAEQTLEDGEVRVQGIVAQDIGVGGHVCSPGEDANACAVAGVRHFGRCRQPAAHPSAHPSWSAGLLWPSTA